MRKDRPHFLTDAPRGQELPGGLAVLRRVPGLTHREDGDSPAGSFRRHREDLLEQFHEPVVFVGRAEPPVALPIRSPLAERESEHLGRRDSHVDRPVPHDHLLNSGEASDRVGLPLLNGPGESRPELFPDDPSVSPGPGLLKQRHAGLVGLDRLADELRPVRAGHVEQRVLDELRDHPGPARGRWSPAFGGVERRVNEPLRRSRGQVHDLGNGLNLSVGEHPLIHVPLSGAGQLVLVFLGDDPREYVGPGRADRPHRRPGRGRLGRPRIRHPPGHVSDVFPDAHQFSPRMRFSQAGS